jgi:hypothetical protein
MAGVDSIPQAAKRERGRGAQPTHGFGRVWNRIPEYYSWTHMRQRCNNPKNARFNYYGARGITICERWNDFAVFLSDMGRKPTPKHSLDRIDVNGNYEPSNCRWATQDVQMQNTRRTSLSEDKVREIWALAATGLGPTEIAKRVGGTKPNIQSVLAGKTWKHLRSPQTPPG